MEPKLPESPNTILEEAQELVYGDRNDAYGHPMDDYTRTGIIWGAMLRDWARDCAIRKKEVVFPIPPELACLMMCAVKISREVNKPKRDNRVDLAGYSACVDRIHNRREGKE